jgi:hypothetical protein
MSNYYDPRFARLMVCERIREARGTCIDGLTFDRPDDGPGLVERLLRLIGRRSAPAA